MSHDLETANDLLERQIKDIVDKYFEFVKHRLSDAMNDVERQENIFAGNGDYHVIKNVVERLSNLNLGHERAIIATHKLALLEEEVKELEHQAENAQLRNRRKGD